MKYVVVSGGVLSGLGKGVTASSIGVLLKSAGLKITSVKIDPYLNSDAGTMSPFEHGEVFVLDDGGEVDLDLGNYERFLDINLAKNNNLTTGKIYSKVIEAERKGDYLGKTVQVIPHITDAIQDWIEEVAHVSADGSDGPPDACIIDVGGTVGDIESAPYVEALRQFQFRVGRENISFVHVSLVPVMGPVGEQKTKPTQHSVKELRGLGITPDILVCRSTSPMTDETKEKLAAFCHVSPDAVMSTHDVPNIYHVPLMLESQGLCNILNVDCNATNLLSEWRKMALNLDTLTEEVSIAMVGKYTELSDAYLSVIKSLQHAAMEVNRKLTINWIEASHLEDSWKNKNNEEFQNSWNMLKSSDGILVPGGFGDRGIEGKILAAQYARTSKVPFLGICLGLQLLFESSEEGSIEGLGIVKGKIKRIPQLSDQRIPHVGWCELLPTRENSLLRNDELNNWVYFVHSYHAVPSNTNLIAANVSYGNEKLTAIIEQDNLIACQFHPEKSGKTGEKLLRRWLKNI